MRDLKHYDKSLKKLERLINALQYKLVHDPKDDDAGVYIPSKRKILLSTELSNSEELAICLHELGHCIYFLVTSEEDLDEMERIYDTFHKDATKGKKAVLRYETAAWDIGEKLAKVLRIPLGKWYYEVKDECLQTYRDHE